MGQLQKLGFIDFCSPGGLRKDGKAAKGYKMSLRWKNWGKVDFQELSETHYATVHG